MAFYVDHTAVDIDGDWCELATIKQPFEDFEIDISEHMGCFVTEGT